jgi:hypothetical protein
MDQHPSNADEKFFHHDNCGQQDRLVMIVKKVHLCSNLLVTKKRKRPNILKMRNDVTVTILGGRKKQEQCNRKKFLRGQVTRMMYRYLFNCFIWSVTAVTLSA